MRELGFKVYQPLRRGEMIQRLVAVNNEGLDVVLARQDTPEFAHITISPRKKRQRINSQSEPETPILKARTRSASRASRFTSSKRYKFDCVLLPAPTSFSSRATGKGKEKEMSPEIPFVFRGRTLDKVPLRYTPQRRRGAVNQPPANSVGESEVQVNYHDLLVPLNDDGGDGDGDGSGAGGSKADADVNGWSPGSQSSSQKPVRRYSGRRIRSRRTSIASAPG